MTTTHLVALQLETRTPEGKGMASAKAQSEDVVIEQTSSEETVGGNEFVTVKIVDNTCV